MSYVLAGALGEVKNRIIKKDGVVIDNFVFRLHHQANFVVLLVGLAITFAEKYIDGDQLECASDVSDYEKKFCFLHGTSFIKAPGDIQKELTGRSCTMQHKEGEEDFRVTAYYMWLPLILTVCMGVCKLPRIIWKNFLEDGFLKSLVTNSAEGTGEKIAESFNNIRNRNKFTNYNLQYAIAELLNVISVLVNFQIIDHLLNGKYWSYGTEVSKFMSMTPKQQSQHHDPMCNVFPTEVACNVGTGSIGGGTDSNSHLCILALNVINQKYFLALWWWWVILLTISSVGFLYRLAQMTVPGVSRLLLRHKLDQAALSQVEPNYWKLMKMSSADLFILSRMAQSLNKDTMTKVLTELKRMQTNNKKTNSAEGPDPPLYPAINDKVTFNKLDETVGMDNKGLLD